MSEEHVRADPDAADEKPTATEAELGLSDPADLPDTHAGSVLRLASAVQRFALLPSVLAGGLGVAIASVFAGWHGALGAFAGVAVALASSFFTLFLMRRTAAANPYLVMAAALGGFAGKMVLLFLAMVALGQVEVIHRESLAYTMFGVIVVWAAAEVMAFRRTKIPTIIPGSD